MRIIRLLVLIVVFVKCSSFSFSQLNMHEKPPFQAFLIDTLMDSNNDLTLPNQRPNFNIRRRITPLVSYKYGSGLMIGGNSLHVHSTEIGAALIRGQINEWQSWGPLPLGWDWNYFTLPFISIEYRWLERSKSNSGEQLAPYKLNPVMLNVGLSAGAGGLVTLLPAPFGLNAVAGLSTDFNELYFRGRIGWDIFGFSIGSGVYYALTSKKSELNNPNYGFVELSYTFIRDNN